MRHRVFWWTVAGIVVLWLAVGLGLLVMVAANPDPGMPA